MRALALLALAAALATPAAAAQAQPLVSLRQTGGFAGFDRGLAVQRSGAVTADELPLATRKLGPTRLRALCDALRDARFRTLAKAYGSDQPIADGFVYRIVYGGRSVRIDEGATLPPRLARVFRLLRALSPAL